VAGQGLWQCGHVDGNRSQALLQFPLAIAGDAAAQVLWVADAGNGQLRRIKLVNKQVETIDLPRRLDGAAGLAVAGGQVWLADTEGHALLRYDPGTGEIADVPIGQ
jgi:streptogramin lyase